MENGYEVVMDDSQFLVVHVWENGTKVTRLFDREEEGFTDVLRWLQEDFDSGRFPIKTRRQSNGS